MKLISKTLIDEENIIADQDLSTHQQKVVREILRMKTQCKHLFKKNIQIMSPARHLIKLPIRFLDLNKNESIYNLEQRHFHF